jgi:cyclophilin family peptidyl-prolyl cis-trans isomerase/protein-disulfide isomerase
VFKKTSFLLTLIGVLLVSACTPNTTETEQPTANVEDNPGETTGETQDEGSQPEISFDDESMPCSTVFEYEVAGDVAQYQAAVDQQPPVTDEDWIYGNPDAPITVVEYEDFQCPACPSFSLGIKDLINQYPSSIRVVFRHLPLPSIHDKAYISSMAAEAAGAQGKFWEMHDLLYINQQEWTGMTEEAFVDWAILQAGALELDIEQFEKDLFDEELRAELETINQQRLAAGMTYTPFVVVNDRVWRNNQPNLYSLIGIYEYGGYEECPPWVIEEDTSYLAKLDTSAGEINIELFAESAPLAVNSFVFLAQEGWFDEVYFHRVIEDFVAQAGDPSGIGSVGPGYTFANEIDNSLSFNRAGILGMANAGADTNGSQFFITLGSATDLDGRYTIFGEVTEESLPILDEIERLDSQTGDNFDDATIIYGIEITAQ